MGDREQQAKIARRFYKYQAFISYSHKLDGGFAAALQKSIEQLGKPWYRRRAVEIFRDQTDLAANPDLWPRIVAALDQSKYLLLLGSTAAAQSPWVAKELARWVSNYDVSKIVIALTDGNIVWDQARSDFDWRQTTAVPQMLAGAFKSEPLWADFREATSTKENAAGFRQGAINIAAGLREMAPRDLDSEDLRQHRRTIRFATAGLITLLMLTIGAIVATVNALHERDLAKARELAALSQAATATDPETGVLLALRAETVLPTPQGEQALRQALPRSYSKSLFRTDGTYFNQLAFSPDGKRIVTASGTSSFLGAKGDFKARVWDLQNGRVQAVFTNTKPLANAAFSPDGRFVLAVGPGSGAWLWAPETGKVVADFSGRETTVNSAAFSADGLHVVTGCANGSAFVWSTAGGNVPLELKHSDSVNDVSFSPDGLSVLTATGKKKLLDNLTMGFFINRKSRFVATVWDARSGKERFQLEGSGEPILMARFSPDGKRIITVSGAEGAVLWDARNGRRVTELRGHTAAIRALAFSGDGRFVATASEDTTARVWDADTGALHADLRLHRQPLTAIGMSNDGRFVVTAGADSYAVVWDVATAKPLGELRGHASAITGLALSPDRQSVATTSYDGTVRLWRIPAGEIVEPMGPVGTVVNMALSSDGERILVENSDKQVGVWARRTGTKIAALNGAVAWSADGKRVVATDSDRAVVYDGGTGAVIKELKGEWSRAFEALALSPNGERLAVTLNGGGAATLTIWDVAAAKVLASTTIDMQVEPSSLQYSSDGSRLVMRAFVSGGSELRDGVSGALIARFAGDVIRLSQGGQQLLEVDGGQCVSNVYDAHSGTKQATFTFPGGDCFHLSDGAMSQDGRYALVLDAKGEAAVWDVPGKRLASEFALDVPTANAEPTLSPDGRFMAIKGQRGVVIWDWREKKKIRTLDGDSSDLALAFTPDGKALVMAGRDGTARVYPAEAFLPMADLVRQAKRSVSRELSEAEVKELSEN
jgi:WD40 repeat protein